MTPNEHRLAIINDPKSDGCTRIERVRYELALGHIFAEALSNYIPLRVESVWSETGDRASEGLLIYAERANDERFLTAALSPSDQESGRWDGAAYL